MKSPLFGRRIHIGGSIDESEAVASTQDVAQARELVASLVTELLERGATFVIPVDAEKCRTVDNQPFCFDWLVWETILRHLPRRPAGAINPLAIAVQHHKTEEQIPQQFQEIWDELRGTDLVQIENVSHWNMNSKRMEAQARFGDILIALGGSEGVLFLGNLYHDAGKPVVPLNLMITEPQAGARRLFDFGLSSDRSRKLFQSAELDPHTWLNRINFSSRTPIGERAKAIIDLLEALEPPRAFAVRLLDSAHEDFAAVQEFFSDVVQPVIEEELGYKLTVVDGSQPFEYSRIDQEIFQKLHRSRVVIADITGLRPNCFLELGYAFGRGLPTLVMIKKGGRQPFDITTVAGLHWTPDGTLEERRKAFRDHWNSVRNRPPLVAPEPLTP